MEINNDYPKIDGSKARITAVESSDDSSEVLLCFYRDKADMQRPDRERYRIGVIRFGSFRDLYAFFVVNSNLVTGLSQTNKFKKKAGN